MEFLRGRPRWVDDGGLVMEQLCGGCGEIVIREEVWLTVLLQIQWMARKRVVIQPRS